MVLFFDSGVGGRSIEKAFLEVCPSISTAYLSDQHNLPYGDKSDDFILDSVNRIVDNYVNKCKKIDCLVIACNTASTLVLPSLRAKYSFPIVGVVPAIKPAAKISKTGHLALLATEATIKRSYTDRLIQDFAASSIVHRFGSHDLVSLAERYYSGEDFSLASNVNLLYKEILPILANSQIDTVVLACTHFSHFKVFFEMLAPHINWIDSIDAVVKQIQKVLLQKY